jgi:hypothetical protein
MASGRHRAAAEHALSTLVAPGHREVSSISR